MADIENPNVIKLFGFEIKRTSKKPDENKLPAIVPPTDDDGAGYVAAAGHHFGHYIDLGGQAEAKDNSQLIKRYRGVSMHPEVDTAIDEIINEAIVTGDRRSCVELNLDDIEASESIKKKMATEFDYIINLLKFQDLGHEIFKSWYIDGRLYHQVVVEEGKETKGIQDVRYVDAAKIRKVKEVKYKKDPKTQVKIVDSVNEFYIYEEKPGAANQGVKLSLDSVSYVTSGLLDQERKRVVSYLHKALKPVNQLRMMEDSLVIYRLARAPERRIFYVDTGSLPKAKADQYMKDIMNRYRNKLVYDANTGQLKDDRKHMSMLEDFWLPRREGGRGTEISTLPGGDNLGQIDDVIYFQKALYRSLNVPMNRLEQEATFSLGRSTEVTREEVTFQKFIDRLRNRFSKLFMDLLKKQLLLKKICTEDDWNDWYNDLTVDFKRDNHFTEMTETEIWRERLTTMDQAQQYVGEFFSKEWAAKTILKLTDEEYEDLKKQMEKEQNEGEYEDQQGGGEEEEAPAAPAPAAPEVTVHNHLGGKKAANERNEFMDEAELALIESAKKVLDE